MSEQGAPTHDQLQAFLTVAEAGSFAAAGRRLNRATSVISYMITNLEHQFGLSLFDRRSTRRPQLTEAGRRLLDEARTVTHSIDALRAKAQSLAGGMETELSLAVSPLMPGDRLFNALTGFRKMFPMVDLRLCVEPIGVVQQQVAHYRAVIGLCVNPSEQDADLFEKVDIGRVEMAMVAAPLHPLAFADRATPDSMREHVQLVISDQSEFSDLREPDVTAAQTWHLSDLGAKLMLLKAGVGWGSMPVHMVEADLAAGHLVELRWPEAKRRWLPLTAFHRTDRPPGCAGQWLLRRFTEQKTADATSSFSGPLDAVSFDGVRS